MTLFKQAKQSYTSVGNLVAQTFQNSRIWSLWVFNEPNPASFGLFLFFSHDKQNTSEKSVDGVLGSQTRGGRMAGADESTELCRHQYSGFVTAVIFASIFFYLEVSQAQMFQLSTKTTKQHIINIYQLQYSCVNFLLFQSSGWYWYLSHGPLGMSLLP